MVKQASHARCRHCLQALTSCCVWLAHRLGSDAAVHAIICASTAAHNRRQEAQHGWPCSHHPPPYPDTWKGPRRSACGCMMQAHAAWLCAQTVPTAKETRYMCPTARRPAPCFCSPTASSQPQVLAGPSLQRQVSDADSQHPGVFKRHSIAAVYSSAAVISSTQQHRRQAQASASQ